MITEIRQYSSKDYNFDNLDLTRFKTLLAENRSELIDLAVKCTRTAVKHHIKDFEYVNEYLDKFSDLKNKFFNDRSGEGFNIMPKGNILITLSENEPFIVTIIPLMHALSMKNVVFVKAASKNRDFVERVISLFKESLTDPKQINMIDFEKTELRQQVDNNVDMVFWFGSSSTANNVSSVLRDILVEMNFEAEGNDMMYISKTANLEQASESILHSLSRHNGQCCNAVKGVLVQKGVEKELLNVLQSKIGKLKDGDPENPESDLSDQLDNNVIKTFLDTVSGSQNNSGNKLSYIFSSKSTACVAYWLNKNNQLLYRPFFGPLIWMSLVDNVSETIDYVNSLKHGLSFTIYSEDKREIAKVEELVRYPRININSDPLDVSPGSPWGGVRLSGTGGSKEWFYKFCDLQFVQKVRS